MKGKKMKIIIVSVFLLTASQNVFAMGDMPQVENQQEILMSYYSDSAHYWDGKETNFCQHMKTLSNKLIIDGKEKYSVECSHIRLELSYKYKSQYYGSTPHIPFFTPSYMDYSYRIDIYCSPRSLVEKQIIGASKSCERDPKPECFGEGFLNQLSKVRSLAIINNVDQNCR